MTINKNISYNKIVSRNFGIFTSDEIRKIRKLNIAIAGVGAIGGHIAISLARIGVGTINIIDPDKFEISNINRQQGSNISTINKFKTKIISKEIKKINPFIKVNAVVGGVNKNNAKKFINKSDCIVDCIDFYNIVDELELHSVAQKLKKPIFTGQIAGSVVSLIYFQPKSKKTLKNYFFPNIKRSVFSSIKKFFPILPQGVNMKLIKKYLKKHSIPSYATTSPILANIITQQIINIFVKHLRPICVSPNVFAFDVEKLKYKIK